MSQTTTSWRCRDFLNNAIVPAALTVNRKDSLVVVGTLLSTKDAPCAIIISEEGAYESIYGYQIVNLILESTPEELHSRLSMQAWEAAEASPPLPLLTIRLDDELTRGLSLIVANRFGNLLVLDDKGAPVGLLSLGDIVGFLAARTKPIGISLKEVSSKLKLVDEGESLSEVFRFMMRNRVRRAVMTSEGGFYCCTEREIMRELFSLNGLKSLKDNPNAILGMHTEHLMSPFLSVVPNLSGSLDTAEGWVQASWNINCTVIVDGKRIASPWDLVVKPFLAGKLPF